MSREIYLTGAIQKEPGRLYEESVRFLQIGCGIPFEPPTGHQRLSTVESLKLKIGTEKNGGLVRGVATMKKYHWAVAGEDMVEGLPDEQRDNVVIVRRLGFQFCQYRPGIWEGVPERTLLAEGRDRFRVLEDLKDGTTLATKPEHINYLRRIIRRRGLNLQAVEDDTPETAPELRRIYVAVDNYETGGTWADLRPYAISAKYIDDEGEERDREILLKSEAVLIKARRLPWGRARMFDEIMLPRADLALEHPERWLNPDILTSTANDEYETHNKGEHRFWNFGKIFSRPEKLPEKVAVASSVLLALPLFTLLTSSAILNPWHSRTSNKKELRS